jgi:F-box-like
LKLPPELLIVIFSHLGRNSSDLRRVTHVCSRWRAIAVNTPPLWTDINVHLKSGFNRKLQALLSRTDLFLNRAGDLPLDVKWHMPKNTKSAPLFYDLFRRKGSFGRWRTLSIDLNEDINHPLGDLRDIDKFSNLESLILMRSPPPAYLERISATITSKLCKLELGPSFRCSPKFTVDYNRIFEHIYDISLWIGADLTAVPLPPNVRMLDSYGVPEWPIPHVQHMFLVVINLRMLLPLRLENLVSLLFHQARGLMRDMSITLPNLLWLGIYGDGLAALEALKTPLLQTLDIRCPRLRNQTVNGPLVAALKRGFEAPNLLNLFLEVGLDGAATLEVVRIFPNVSHVDLHFRHAGHAQEVLSHVFPRQRDLTICPILDVLFVVLGVPPRDNVQWEECVRNTGSNIGEPLWLVTSEWPGGTFGAEVTPRTGEKTPYIEPWVRDAC